MKRWRTEVLTCRAGLLNYFDLRDRMDFVPPVAALDVGDEGARDLNAFAIHRLRIVKALSEAVAHTLVESVLLFDLVRTHGFDDEMTVLSLHVPSVEHG